MEVVKSRITTHVHLYTSSLDQQYVLLSSNWSNFWHAFTSRRFVSDSWTFLFKYYYLSVPLSVFNVWFILSMNFRPFVEWKLHNWWLTSSAAHMRLLLGLLGGWRSFLQNSTPVVCGALGWLRLHKNDSAQRHSSLRGASVRWQGMSVVWNFGILARLPCQMSC